MKNFTTLLFYSFITSFPLLAQESFTFPSYDGFPVILTATTSTVNDDIIITFRDSDIINNFFTAEQANIYMYGGFDTDAGAYKGAPELSDLASQPVLALSASDNDFNSSPNSYTISINLAQHYSGVANATTIYGFNLLFQNQFSGGGNNQTVDLYIDLIDAKKDSTLSLNDFDENQDIIYINGEVLILNYYGEFTINQFDVLGRKTKVYKGVSDSKRYSVLTQFPKNQLILLKFESPDFYKTLKIISL